MLRRIRELESQLAVLDPARCVRDVEATGACFFIAGNIGRQSSGLATQTHSDEQLRSAADSDRLAVAALMLQQRAVPGNDGETL